MQRQIRFVVGYDIYIPSPLTRWVCELWIWKVPRRNLASILLSQRSTSTGLKHAQERNQIHLVLRRQIELQN